MAKYAKSKASPKALVRRWARGHELAARRIAEERRRHPISFEEALDRVTDLQNFANDAGAVINAKASEAENLAYHLAWAKLRRAFDRG